MQGEIAKRFPLIAYIPRGLPAGFRFSKFFSSDPGGYILVFHKTGAPFWDTIAFEVAGPSHRRCGLSGTKLSVDGVVVDWSGKEVLEQAGRCINVGKTFVLVMASRAEPIRRADFPELAHMVVAIRHVS